MRVKLRASGRILPGKFRDFPEPRRGSPMNSRGRARHEGYPPRETSGGHPTPAGCSYPRRMREMSGWGNSSGVRAFVGQPADPHLTDGSPEWLCPTAFPTAARGSRRIPECRKCHGIYGNKIGCLPSDAAHMVPKVCYESPVYSRAELAPAPCGAGRIHLRGGRDGAGVSASDGLSPGPMEPVPHSRKTNLRPRAASLPAPRTPSRFSFKSLSAR
jgi:hypothetical protein